MKLRRPRLQRNHPTSDAEEMRDAICPDDLLPHGKQGPGYYDYFMGDVYEQWAASQYTETGAATQYEDTWAGLWGRAPKPMPYLNHIKSLRSAWPHLRFLAQWMDVTTSPVKWQLIKNHGGADGWRKNRASRTKVAAIDFVQGQSPPKVKEVTNTDDLSKCLDQPIPKGTSRLYVVEDLSRDVIELLGWKLDLDPLFFRQQINDYLWFNTRDSWVEMPDLDVVSRNRPFFTFVYAHPRYFKDHATFKAAQIEAGGFNVLRRLDDDSDHGSMFDDDGAIVALVRSKASLWIRPKKDPSDKEEDALGVLLIDPSIKSGFPLWCGYRPFENSPTPSQRQQSYEAPERKSLFDDLIFWIKKMTQRDMDKIRTNPNVMAYRISQIICAEWLSLSRYASTRLRQIEWEVERPAFRRQPKEGVDSSLSKSHTWRRRLPLYRTMVADTRKHLFQKDPKSSSSSSSSSSSANNKDKDDDKDDDNCVADLADDFANVARNLDDLLQQTERITAVTTAVAAFEESRRAVEQNQSLGRLTYLAVIFAPLSFVSSFFSMAPDVVDLAQTFWIYFCVAVPVSIGVYLVVENSWHATLKTWYAGDVEGSGGDNTTIMAWFRKMNVGKRGHVRDGDTLLQGGGAAAVGVQQGMTATTMGNGNDPMVKK